MEFMLLSRTIENHTKTQSRKKGISLAINKACCCLSPLNTCPPLVGQKMGLKPIDNITNEAMKLGRRKKRGRGRRVGKKRKGI